MGLNRVTQNRDIDGTTIEQKIVKKKPKKKLFNNKKKQKPIVVNRRLESIASDVDSMEFASRKEIKEFKSTIKLMDIKSILVNTKNQPLELGNGYAKYMQILEIQGKDIYKISVNERLRSIANFESWLSRMAYDLTFVTTKLPTNTTKQVSELYRLKSEIEHQLSEPSLSENQRYQLEERHMLIMEQIEIQEIVEAQLYNTEYLLFLFADSLSELEEQIRRSDSSGDNDFVPSVVSYERKVQFYKQYNNQNERV